jgi:alanyl-tRNA synthetase
VLKRFDEHDIPFETNRNLIPSDTSTLFVCSGMQLHKKRFHNPDGGRLASLQSCLRTDDIDLVGDGSHLTYFEMLGNFSFGNHDYADSVDLWHSLVLDLALPVTSVHVHPDRRDHADLWLSHGYPVVPDLDCEWSDGDVGGHCCELYCGDLEIGNLVNPNGGSTDVGFGWERVIQVVEGKSAVHETSLFRSGIPPVLADHERAVIALRENGIEPGNKGRAYVCRRLLRRMLRLIDDERFAFDDWLDHERRMREDKLRQARRMWRRHSGKPPEWWWDTLGILPDELIMVARE